MYIDYSKITTEVLEQIYNDNKDDIEVLFQITNRYINERIKEEVVLENLKKLRTVGDDHFQCRVKLITAKYCLNKDNLKEAKMYLEQVKSSGDYKYSAIASDRLSDLNKRMASGLPEFMDVYKEAKLYSKYRQYKEALKRYEECLSIEPDNLFVINEMAYVNVELGNYDKASEYYNRLFDGSDKDKNLGVIGLTKIAILEGDYDKAYGLINELKIITLKDQEIKDNLLASIFYLKGDYEKELTYLENNLNSNDINIRAKALLKQGVAYVKLSNGVKAIEAFEQIKDKSKLRDTYDILGSLYFTLGNYEKALENYQEYYDREGFMPTLLNIVDCYVLLGNDIKAIEILNYLKNSSNFYRKDLLDYHIMALSLKYNIFFDGFDYKKISDKKKALIHYDLTKNMVRMKMQHGLYINTPRDFKEFIMDLQGRLKQSRKVSYTPYELYDVYKVYYPGIGKNNEDYLIVQTIPGTWNIVDFYATLEPDLVFPRKIIDKKKAVLRLHHN